MHEASHIADNVAGIIALLLIAAVVLAFTKRIKLPFSVVLVLVGIGVTYLADRAPHLLGPLHELTLSPDLILYVFLPTLIFESAFNLDVRQLRQNLLSVLTLAVPGLLLSTAIIGSIITYFTPIPLLPALLLGSILSATDPVAVIALFKRLGAPQRLTILVEGESLFNDATAIVLAGILVVMVTGQASADGFSVVDASIRFFVVFMGGLIIGWLMGWITGLILGLVRSDPNIETTLTTILAYASFLIAEEVFHVSGVMATVAAGLTLGGWGRMKLSAPVRNYVNHFWEYMGFVATALIFLMVGMRVDITALISAADILVVVLIAMLFSRALVVFGLIPVVNKLPRVQTTGKKYQAVMYWGGLRGAIALAIVLSIPAFEYSEVFVAVVMGAVLFTLIVQGLTMEMLVQRLGLNQPPLADRIAEAEGTLAAKQHALSRLPELQTGGMFSTLIAEHAQLQCEAALQKAREHLHAIRAQEVPHDIEINLLYLRCFANEKAMYIDLFNKGHLSESSLRAILGVLVIQIDVMRFQGQYRSVQSHRLPKERIFKAYLNLLDHIPVLNLLSEHMRLEHIVRAYEQAWAHFQACQSVIEHIDDLAKLTQLAPEQVEEISKQYHHWQQVAQDYIDQMSEQYPEFVDAMQQRLSHRLILLAEQDAIHHQRRQGVVPASVAEEMLEDIDNQLWRLRGQEVDPLKVGPSELLRKVPFFADIAPEAFEQIASRMHSHSTQARENIIKQGKRGDALYLIARGVVRVSREENGRSTDLATLKAGDFFGEMALINDEPRVASVNAVTTCSLYVLQRKDLALVMKTNPSIRAALEHAAHERGRDLSNGDPVSPSPDPV